MIAAQAHYRVSATGLSPLERSSPRVTKADWTFRAEVYSFCASPSKKMSSDLRHPGKTAKTALTENVPYLPIVSRLARAARSAGLTIPPGTTVLAVQHMVRTN